SCRYKKREYCAQHAPNGIVDVKNRKCRTQGCRKGRRLEWQVQQRRSTVHSTPDYNSVSKVQGQRGWPTPLEGKHWQRNSSGAKHSTVHPPPTKTSQPSGVSPDSHKRVRHPDVTSTMSKRAIARKSTAEAVTMPDI
ncbi:unnamed protein product, partial [Ascophyllum nodosum]